MQVAGLLEVQALEVHLGPGVEGFVGRELGESVQPSSTHLKTSFPRKSNDPQTAEFTDKN